MLLVAWLAIFSGHALGQEAVEFKVQDSITAKAQVIGASVKILIEDKDSTHHQEIITDSERALNLETEDYNFDGLKDISISHIDEGKGVFLVSRIYIYSTANKKFIEQQPACGDEFINLKLNKTKKTLSSIYYAQNTPKMCTTRLTRLASN